MKKQTIEKLFVLAVFILTYTILIQKVSLTGYVINLNSYTPPERLSASDVEYRNVYVELNSNTQISLNDLQKGNTVVINQDKNKYNIVIMQVVQDFSNGNEAISLLIEPGARRLTLREGEQEVIDFNSDGKDDANLIVESISNNKVNLILKTK